jgi:UDP-N-acetylmuramoylalanine--D-glutamate ligase
MVKNDMMSGLRVLVFGMARSGAAAVNLLRMRGAHVIAADEKSRDELGDQIDSLTGIELHMGEPVEPLLDNIDMLVVSPGIPVAHTAIVAAKRMGIEVIGELELAYRLGQGRLIAITGTNGKTTTTALTGEIFKNAGKQTYVVGNIGNAYSSVAGITREDDILVCEVSSFQLETVDKFHPSVAAILNITQDHLDRPVDMECYISLKMRVLANQGADDIVVLNYDDPVVRGMSERAKGEVIWFSRTQIPPSVGAYISSGVIVYGAPGAERTVCAAGDIFIPGQHNLENALAASAIAMAAGVPAPVIRHTLRTFKGVEHRLEFVRELDSVRFINDSKGTNADSTLKAIQAMDRPTVIILGGYDKHVDFTELAAMIAGDGRIKAAVLIGETAERLASQLKGAGCANIHLLERDFKAAIAKAFSLAKTIRGEGCALLSPACASFDMFRDYEHRGTEFKRIVNALGE